MTKENKISELERMLKGCPEILTPQQASKWSPLGKNRVYALVKNGEIKSFIYRGGYIIAKSDLIEYLAEHSDDPSPKKYSIKGV